LNLAPEKCPTRLSNQKHFTAKLRHGHAVLLFGHTQNMYAAGPKTASHFLRLSIGLLVFASPLIMCAIVALHTCNFTVVDFDNSDSCFCSCYEYFSTITSLK